MFGKVEIALRTFSRIYGQTVYNVKNGAEIGIIEDLLINEHGKVIGFLIDKRGWLNRDLFVPLQAVTGFGNDSIMVENMKLLKPFEKSEKIITLKEGKNRLSGKPLLTTEGEKLGLVEDVYFMEEMGTIIGYEITEGLIADIKDGKKVVKTKQPLTIGKDILVIQI